MEKVNVSVSLKFRITIRYVRPAVNRKAYRISLDSSSSNWALEAGT